MKNYSRSYHGASRKTGHHQPETLNEAYDYGSAFSRGMRIDLNGLTILLISGTASIDERAARVHVGDFRAQTRRTFENITELLAAEGATWKDIVRTTCYLRDIERDYEAFNEERTAFFQEQGLDPLPGVHRYSGDSLPAGPADRDRSDCHVPAGNARGVVACVARSL